MNSLLFARTSAALRPVAHLSLRARCLATSNLNVDYGKTFDKILIANRGEIAVRVIKTAKKMGIKTVAVYSDADANSLHVRLADEAVNIGPAPTAQSYLVVPNIIRAIQQTGAQAVHPGYGFLSENSHFVEALDKAGVTFIGPTARSMFLMGDKIESKKIAKAAGVHTIPGFDGEVENVEHGIQIANDIGYPVMVKASAGGGGKGMRIAYNDKECREAFRLSKQEAKSSFGDDRMLVEKFIEEPRHIEIQLIGDQHGNTFYLPERECSIQRRNQKVIEEAPSVHIDEATRKAMGEQAVALAKNVGYFSAGTCEFLVDPKRNFYFLEMNTRLQVEHPITEYITGLDLVELMIRVAANQKLNLSQTELAKPKGWAFESRVYAEDPEKYLPSIGRLTKYIEPAATTPSGHDLRCDSGIVEGSEISIYYDPMICKLCTYGETRELARTRMESALDRYVIQGVTHNIPLLRDVMSHPRFTAGKFSTKFLAEEYPEGFKGAKLDEKKVAELFAVAAVVHAKRDLRKREWVAGAGSVAAGAATPSGWDLNISLNKTGESERVLLLAEKDGSWKVSVGGKTMPVNMDWKVESPIAKAVVDGSEVVVQYLDPLAVGYRLQYLGTKFEVTVQSPRQHELSKHMKEKPKLDLTSVLLSPMPGTVVNVAVKEGDVVAEGAEMATLEAMKMQNLIHSPRSGKVAKVHIKAGQSVAGDEILIELEKEVVKA
ncbi:carbamoyl-phosphate synthase L chain, ATP binding domain-containing protein [Chytriomyces sp. MP71]|nr:carbamoyl-phosphate synthase L chain, ATP binding domain-containing protein [Chytriomyces sp. MP71]